MPLTDRQLLKSISNALSHSCEYDALHNYLQDMLAALPPCTSLVLYEPDVSNTTLHASTVLQGDSAGRLTFPVFAVNDLGNLLSQCYVTRTAIRPMSLHSHVSSSDVFKQFQAQFSLNPTVCLQPLQRTAKEPALAVLLILTDTASSVTHLTSEDSISLRLLSVLLGRVRRAARLQSTQHELKYEIARRDERAYQRAQQDNISKSYIGNSESSQKVQSAILNAAGNEQAVLIQGETGTGKNRIAALIHQNSSRADKPFVAVNCAAFPAELIGVELFGARQGAFSDSMADKQGLIEVADGGVLFLDNIGDMPKSMQVALLRVLNEKCFRRIGDVIERPVDCRLISATSAVLSTLVEEDIFRHDLLYRLCQSRINTSPLRDHMDDIPALCQTIVQQHRDSTGYYFASLSVAETTALRQHNWPGNVRELENFLIAYLDNIQAGSHHTEYDITARLHDWQDMPSNDITELNAALETLLESSDFRTASETFERELISRRMAFYQGDRNCVASSLNLPKRTLAYKCQKLNIDTEGVVAV